MTRLQPNKMYKCFIKSLKTNQSQTVKWTGARLDHYMRHEDFLVTVTSDEEQKVYPKAQPDVTATAETK